MLCRLQSRCQCLPFSCVFRLYNVRNTLTGMVALTLRAFQPLYNLFDFLYGFIRGTVIHHNDLQLFRWIILVDAALDGFLNPGFLVKAWNNHRNPGSEIGVYLFRAVKSTKQVTAHQKECRDNTVQIQPLIEFKINNALRAHQQNKSADKKQHQGCHA